MAKAKKSSNNPQVLTATIAQIKNKIAKFPPKFPIYVAGSPGIGKSNLFEQVAADRGATYLRFPMAVKDAVDIAGCPFPVNGYTEFLPPRDLMDLTVESDYKGPAVANFDDLPAAEESVFNALLGIMLERTVGTRHVKIRDNVLLCATGNRAEDRAGARDLTTALNNRFCHFNMSVDAREWLSWAVNANIMPEITGYIRAREDKLNDFDPTSSQRAFATPRSIAMASEIIKSVGLEDADINLAVASAVGEAWAMEFMAWVRETRSLVQPEDIFKNPTKCRVPGRDEIDIMHATIATLLHALAKDKDNINKLEASVTYSTRFLQADIGIVLTQDIAKTFIHNASPEVTSKFTSTKGFDLAHKKFGDFLA